MNHKMPMEASIRKDKEITSTLDVIYKTDAIEVYEEEAEQSRLMMAVSAGQELMASFFNLIRESGKCAVSKIKMIEWKLSRAGWWVTKQHHEFIPCTCPVHNRTPLDVLRIQLSRRNMNTENSSAGALLSRTATVEDIRKLRSSIV